MTVNNPLSALLRNKARLFEESPELSTRLLETGLLGVVAYERIGTLLSDGSLLYLLRRFLAETAMPNSLYLLTSDSGETVGKARLFEEAFAPLLERAPAFSDRVSHLMCFAGADGEGNSVLLNVPKPVFGNASVSPLLMRTGASGENGHLVLNQQTAAKICGGFSLLEAEALESLTGGMVQHGVNFLLSADRYDSNLDLRVVFCDSLFDQYWSHGDVQVRLIEVPLSFHGNRYSVVMPLEVFLAFLTKVQRSFPHFEFGGVSGLMADSVGHAMRVLTGLLQPESLSQILKYNPKRPVMATFNAIVGQLTAEFCLRAPYIPKKSAQAVISNYVRHFFSVEHALLGEALAAPEGSLQPIYERIRATEFGCYLVPCEDLGAFRAKIQEERGKKQPLIPFTFSGEVSKSSLYFQWLERMGEKLPYHVAAVARESRQGIAEVLETLRGRIAWDCAERFPSSDSQSLRSAVVDFVEIIFGGYERLSRKIQTKLQVVSNPSSATDRVTAEYWEQYWGSTKRFLAECGAVPHADTLHQQMIRRAIAPELILLESLPFAQELGIRNCFGSLE